MGRGKQTKPTKNAHLVPDNHKCSKCGKGKDEVNFKVNDCKGRLYPELRCNTCRGTGHKDKPKVRKRDMSTKERIDQYFRMENAK